MRFYREQYLELMNFGTVERPMFVELFGPLIGLDREWKAQGATEDEINMVAFDWDYVTVCGCGGNTGFHGKHSDQIIEENNEYIMKKDYLGRTTKLFKQSASIPLPLDFPVKTMDDWLKLKPNYEFCEDRITWTEVEKAAKLQQEGCLVVGHIPGGFDLPRQLLGEEAVCLCYYEQPELMHDILETAGNTCMEVLGRISEKLQIDQLSVHEDMAGKSGPLIGPMQMEEFVKPYFRSVWDMLSSRGTTIFAMDSDGDMNPLVDSLLDCGLNHLYPFEPAAGMDIVEARRKYGKKLSMRGGIDKHVLRQGKDAIRKELEYKLQPLMQEGGIAFGLDHRIPNGTPLENYRYYVDLGREMLGLPPRPPDQKGWRRMAF